MAQEAFERQTLPAENSHISLLDMSLSAHRPTAPVRESRRLSESNHERVRRPPNRTKSAPMQHQEAHNPSRTVRAGRRRDELRPHHSSDPVYRPEIVRPVPMSIPAAEQPPQPLPLQRRPRSSSVSTDSHRDMKSLSIEVSPGVVARLRGARETYQAVENDFYRPTICQACQADVCCIMDASYLLCPMCRSVSPIEGGSTDIATGGVGLGFTLDDLRTWQAKILASRSRGQRRRSMH